MSNPDAAQTARRTWRTLEPVHAMIYFVPEAASAYEALGIRGTSGYFASRSAPMGAVSADVVISTFFNFNPELVRQAIPRAWEVTTPRAIVGARLNAVDASMRRLLGESALASEEMTRASVLARSVAEAARTTTEGRPLAAGFAGLDWPEDPHLVLWQAQAILPRVPRGRSHCPSGRARPVGHRGARVSCGDGRRTTKGPAVNARLVI